MAQDLWPEDFGIDDFVTPVTLLKEQAALLGSKTHNLVEATVSTGSNHPDFIHILYLIAPALDNYRYQLITLRHTIDLYPVQINYLPTNQKIEASNPEAYKNILRQLLNDTTT